MNDERTVKLDRMRFTKNTSSSRLALLGIVFDVLYFISIYKSDVKNYYYTILIGASIIYNLVFMLSTFLCSEGVKNYKHPYSLALLVLGVIQIARIFILPLGAHQAEIDGMRVMGDGQFIRLVIYLTASALCLFASAAVNLKKSRALDAHLASLRQVQA